MHRIREELAGTEGVSVGGYALAQEQVNQQVEEDLRMAEMLAFPLLFLLSLVFFRSLVASLLPLMIGALAISAPSSCCGASELDSSRSSPST